MLFFNFLFVKMYYFCILLIDKRELECYNVIKAMKERVICLEFSQREMRVAVSILETDG